MYEPVQNPVENLEEKKNFFSLKAIPVIGTFMYMY